MFMPAGALPELVPSGTEKVAVRATGVLSLLLLVTSGQADSRWA